MPVKLLVQSGSLCYNNPVSNEFALYFHFPFCRRKCSYCSFISYPDCETYIPEYMECLKQELALRAAGVNVSSIYLGGGTPSLLTASQIEYVLSSVAEHCILSGNAEVTLEANPGTIDVQYLKDIKATGINRLSIGVQSLNDGELSLLGRIHSAEEAKSAVTVARGAGFDNINLDLIYGLPGQSVNAWTKTLEEALRLEPEHISLYLLTLEEDVPLQRAIDRGDVQSQDADMCADHYECAEGLLERCGYEHYEISNWSRPGYQCRHNLAYWENRPYIGLGVAAHSCYDGHRIGNTPDIRYYIESLANGSLPESSVNEVINDELAFAEAVILGLRLTRGVSRQGLLNRYGMDIELRYGDTLREMAQLGLVESHSDRVRLTTRGRLLSNEVFWRLLP